MALTSFTMIMSKDFEHAENKISVLSTVKDWQGGATLEHER
jgi:hypothetical protein